MITEKQALKVIKEWYGERFGRTIADKEAEAILMSLEKAYNNGEIRI